eukprot:CAMPEP_0177202342 /NCGR_PEP_ID=MMETSP0367-20130122/27241_1 /TAXON_ID=447022 ORGANISM="Scrippsiella hangoei-like, Strain SHHI-4" /NCGR_SAMPLE_ID=MMETSP0367 /ASSEMBLY_ACC=CAM_ASM_000362 /LENGTH=311 /DNA_ID=CAMNT_0018650921 /DNA_START=557 /DNA_END=1490 /DNA_ORIENTATION=+
MKHLVPSGAGAVQLAKQPLGAPQLALHGAPPTLRGPPGCSKAADAAAAAGVRLPGAARERQASISGGSPAATDGSAAAGADPASGAAATEPRGLRPRDEGIETHRAPRRVAQTQRQRRARSRWGAELAVEHLQPEAGGAHATDGGPPQELVERPLAEQPWIGAVLWHCQEVETRTEAARVDKLMDHPQALGPSRLGKAFKAPTEAPAAPAGDVKSPPHFRFAAGGRPRLESGSSTLCWHSATGLPTRVATWSQKFGALGRTLSSALRRATSSPSFQPARAASRPPALASPKNIARRRVGGVCHVGREAWEH